MRNISFIKLHFENCDSISIDGKYIGSLIISGIRRDISRIVSKKALDRLTAERIVIEFHAEANEKYNEFGLEKGNKVKKFDRIRKGMDIVSVEVFYDKFSESGLLKLKSEEFFTTWSGDGHANQLQKAEITEHGDLVLMISKNESLSNWTHATKDLRDMHWDVFMSNTDFQF